MEPHLARILEQMQVPGFLSPCRTPAQVPAAPLRVCRVREVVRPLANPGPGPIVTPACADPLGLEDSADSKDSRPRMHQIHRLIVNYGGQRRQFRSLWGLRSLLLHLASPDSPAVSTWTILTRPQGNLRLGQWVHQRLPLNHWLPANATGAWQLEVGRGRPLFSGGGSVTPSLHALPGLSGLPHDGPRRRWPSSRPVSSAGPASSPTPTAVIPDSPREARGVQPFVGRAANKPGKGRRRGNDPPPPVAAQASPHHSQGSAFTSPGLRGKSPSAPPSRKGGPFSQPPHPVVSPGRSPTDPGALQEQEALDRLWESGGHGSPIPWAPSPDTVCRRSHHEHTHAHRPGVRRTKDMTTSLVSDRSKHVAKQTVITSLPLKQQAGMHSRAQTLVHDTRQPTEHGLSHQGMQSSNEPVRHPAPAVIASGAACVAPMLRRGPIIVNHPAVCNAKCVNMYNMSHDSNHAFQPLPPVAVRMLPSRKQKGRRNGMRVRPWACPARHGVSLAASKGDVTSCQP